MQIPPFFKMNYPCKESFRHEKFPYEIETNKRKRKRERMEKKEKNIRRITTHGATMNVHASLAAWLREVT